MAAAGRQMVRSLFGDSAAVQAFVRAQPGLASVQRFLVIVNNTKTYGGMASGGVAWSSTAQSTWTTVAVHELGHQAFGLADEYPYENDLADPVRSYGAGSEPSEPNITTVTDVSTMKWGDLVTLPASFVPSTVATVPCVRDHQVKPASPPIPDAAVGAFEGGGYFDCGIFRPSVNCKMRENPRPFCRVCEQVARANLGHYMLVQGTGAVMGAGAWTHVQCFTSGANPRTLAYNAGTGAFAISDNLRFLFLARRPDGSPPLVESNPAFGTGNIGPDFTWLVPFTLGGNLHYLGQRFGSGQLAMFVMNATGDTLTQTFISSPGITQTHVVPLTLGGAPHFIAYNSFTGAGSLFRIDDDATDPVLLNTTTWGAGHTALLSMSVDGDPFVLSYQIPTGVVMLRRIIPTGFVMAFASASGFWRTNITHVGLLDLPSGTFVARYSAMNGQGAIDHVRAGGAGIDFVCKLTPPPGLGGLSVLGVGAPALGRMSLPTASGFSNDLFFYSAQSQTIRSYPLS